MRKHSSTKIASLRKAFHDFLVAPDSDGYGSNEKVVVAVMGARGVHASDCAQFDAVRLKYEVPTACTFEDAFRACWGRYRDWRRFDLETLQECHEEFRFLRLPAKIEQILEQEEINEYYERAEYAA